MSGSAPKCTLRKRLIPPSGTPLRRPRGTAAPRRIGAPLCPLRLPELRHTAAHVLAYAVQDLFPEAKPTIGPSIENGFYYDFDRAEPFTPEDLERLERAHARDRRGQLPDDRPRSHARRGDRALFAGNPYKVEIAREIPEGEPITLYTIGEFTDLCRGGHAHTTGEIGAFKLTSVAGAYWRGDERKPMLQRIYGTAWYDARRTRRVPAPNRGGAEARPPQARRRTRSLLDRRGRRRRAGVLASQGRDRPRHHRRTSSAKGCANAVISRSSRRTSCSEKLYEISGHLENFAQNMFGPIEVEEQRFRLKPMNCPGHILIYRSRLHSYRELPIRYSEFGTVYRFERSGVLHGLTRVRGFTQDDAHLFCTPEQLQGEFEQTLDEALRLMKAFGFTEFEYVLSTREERSRRDRCRSPKRRSARRWRRTSCPSDRRGRRRVLRAQARHQRARRDRPQVAARHRAGRLHPARALRAEVPRRRRARPHAGDDSPRARRARWSVSSASSSSISAAHSPPGSRPSRRCSRRYPSIRSSTPQRWRRKLTARASASRSTKATRSSAIKFATGRRRKCPTF